MTESHNDIESMPESPPRWIAALYWIVLAACAIVPWILHVTVGWWAGLVSIPVLFAVYDRLFVPRGSLCMGVFFVIPLSGAIVLCAMDLLLLMRWAFGLVAGS